MIGDQPDIGEFIDYSHKLPIMCQQAIELEWQCLETADRQHVEDDELRRDLSLAQLDVLEMLEERVGERPLTTVEQTERALDMLDREDPVVDNTRFFNRLDEISQRIESGEEPDCAAASVFNMGGMRTGEHADDPKVIVFEPGTRVSYDPRKDPFFHPEVATAKHPWEFKG